MLAAWTGASYESLTESRRYGVWRSQVAHLLWEQRVAGSNPATPTSAGGPVRGVQNAGKLN